MRNPNIQLSAENVQLSISNSKDSSASVKSDDHSLFSRGEASVEKVGDLFGLSKSSDHKDHQDHKHHAAKDPSSTSSPNHGSSGTSSIPPAILSKGAILLIEGISEAAMQPFQSTQGPLGDSLTSSSNFFFRPDREFNVTVYEDPKAFDAPGPGLADVGGGTSSKAKAKVLGKGKLKLGKGRYVDSVDINKDPFEQLDGTAQYRAWKAKLDAIGREFE